eukprot:TRINITY_DN2087_c0_g1_i1.p1 TRINITY_DN2087_c0_g1~~TRINITY_DN2087_c0_g1_i1.p1  ORF type:complete len:802 (+),score=153.16 TRINITY_DN2087_c0_g1_i1:47-2452(+)
MADTAVKKVPPPLPPKNSVAPPLPPKNRLSLPVLPAKDAAALHESIKAVHCAPPLPPKPTIITSPGFPHGWEVRLDGTGRPYYVDHVNKRSTYDDPRITTQPSQIQAPPPQVAQNDFDGAGFERVDIITETEKAKYARIFKQVDQKQSGFFEGSDAKSFFPRSGLPSAQLAAIWRLSDFNQDAKLDPLEFELAMHFIVAALKGHQLPVCIPASLIPTVKQSHFVNIDAPVYNPNNDARYLEDKDQTPAPKQSRLSRIIPALPKKSSKSFMSAPATDENEEVVERGSNLRHSLQMPASQREPVPLRRHESMPDYHADRLAALLEEVQLQDKEAGLYETYKAGRPQPHVDYLAKAPQSVRTARWYLETLLAGKVQECYNRSAPHFQQALPLPRLAEFVKSCQYYKDYWNCTATTIEQRGSTLVYIPLNGAEVKIVKAWVTPDQKISGFMLTDWSDDKWCSESGQRTNWITSQPRTVPCLDGTTRQILTLEDERNAILDPAVPKGIAVGPEMRFKVSLYEDVTFKNLDPRKPVAMAFLPPEHLTQKLSPNSFTASPASTPLQHVPFNDQVAIHVQSNTSRVTVRADFEMVTRNAVLRPLYDGHEYVRLRSPISDQERRHYLASTKSMPHDSRTFQSWLQQRDLFIRSGESKLAFARRAFIGVSKAMLYLSPCSFDFEAIVTANQGDCGCINRVFVATLRANGVPARLLYGRHAKSIVIGQTVTFGFGDQEVSNGKQFKQTHVQSQFYDEIIGWIPTDPTSTVRNKNPQFNENDDNSMVQWFGFDRGTFLTFCLDEPTYDSPIYR